MKSKTILVTGGAGFIGSHLVDRLLQDKQKVIVVDDFNNYYSPLIKRSNLETALTNPNLVVIDQDIRHQHVFNELFETYPIDSVAHLAARAGVRPSLEDPNLYWDVNVMGSLNLLEAMKKFQVKQLIFASSSSVYGNRDQGPFKETDNTDNQISPYGASKKALELLVTSYAHLYGIKSTGFRFFTAYGPRNRPDMACYLFTDAILNQKPIKQFGDGSTGRDYTYVDDIVEALIKAINKPFDFEIINLGNSHPVLLRDLIKTIETASSKTAVIEEHPAQPGDVSFTFADISKAKKLLGWQPKVSLEAGIKSLIKWQTSQ